MASLQEWKKAVIHLECAGDTKSFEERIKEWHELSEKVQSGEISSRQWSEQRQQMAKESRKMRFQGTALLLEHESRHYLLTARHVVDEHIARCANRSTNPSPEELDEKKIFSIIFRVPTLDEILSGISGHREFLMNLGAGVTWAHPYTFSEYPQCDLALISLDSELRHGPNPFLEELIRLGYSPISSSDILEEPSAEGADIYTVGFPGNISVLGRLNLPAAIENWSSTYVSLPTYSFGKVSMLHPTLSFFWADMSIFPGNSGGPVIENNRLVGIISSQTAVTVDDRPEIQVRAPFARVIKARFIRDLLGEQIRKDLAASELASKRTPNVDTTPIDDEAANQDSEFKKDSTLETLCEIRCQHCGGWMRSMFQFGSAESFFSSALSGNTQQCQFCGKMTDTNKENMRFTERREDGRVIIEEGKDTF